MECIDTVNTAIFPNEKRKDYINKLNNLDYLNLNPEMKIIKNILDKKNILNIINETQIFERIKKYYNSDTKLVKYVKIKQKEKIIFVGDVHGDLDAIINVFSLFDNNHIVFLGDIVDRGNNSLECLIILFLYKSMYPENIHIIRGNHECSEISIIYGFLMELKIKQCDFLHKTICEIFSHLPIIYIFNNEHNIFRICGVHGCISNNTDLKLLENESHIEKNNFDECWNDPHSNDNNVYDEISARGSGFYINHESIIKWMELNCINCIIRAHEVAKNGYAFRIKDKNLLLQIFSHPNYCGIMNGASIVVINDNFTICDILIYDNLYENKYGFVYDTKDFVFENYF